MDEKEIDKDFKYSSYELLFFSFASGVSIFYLSFGVDTLIYGLGIFSRVYDITSLGLLLSFNLYILAVFKMIRSKLKNKQISKKSASRIVAAGILATILIDFPFLIESLYISYKYLVSLHNIT